MDARAAIGLVLALALAACSPAAPPRTPIPVDAQTPESAPWEREFSASELRVYRTGRVIEERAGDEGAPAPAPDVPIAGARVDLLAPRPGGAAPLTVVATTESDADGHFRVGPGLPENWVLRIAKDGYTTTVGGRAADYPGIVLLPAGGDVTMVLRPAVVRSGVLRDESGDPLPDEPLAAYGEAYREEVRTGPDGRFVIHPPATHIRLEPLGEAFLRLHASADAATEAALELRVVRRGVIRGSVVELATGRPLAGALVAWDRMPQLHTRSDESGRFELPEPRTRPLGPGPEGRLAASAAGWGWRSISLPPAGDVEFRLQRGTAASGRVLDGAGEPVAGARILAVSPAWDGETELVRGPLTGADGRFVLDWLPVPPRGATDPVMLLAHLRGQGASEARQAPADGSPLEFVLPGERTVRGRITRASGGGVHSLPLELRWTEWGLRSRAAARLPFAALVEGGTANDGTFELHGAPLAREANLRAFLDGGVLDTVVPGPSGGPSDDTSGGAITELPIVLEGGGTLTGRLVDVAGEPLRAGGSVVALATDHAVFTRIERRTELVDGDFRLTDLPDAGYFVSADVDGMLVPSIRARIGDDVRLVASRIGRLIVRVVFPDDAEPEDVVVRFSRDGSASDGRRMDVPAETGTASAAVQAGVFDLEASGGVWRAAAHEIRLGDGEERVVELRLERTLRVRARLLEPDGRPIAGGRVRFFAADEPGRKPEVHYSDADGWLDVTGLTPGRWEARVVLADRAPLSRLVPTQDLPEVLELRLPPHGSIEVRVRTLDGGPAAGALIDISAPDGEPVDAWGEGARQLQSRFRADDEGRVLVRGVATGRVIVSARRGPHDLGRAEATVVVGDPVQVTIN